jgi:hypothetical protein
MAEAMFVSALRTLLLEGGRDEMETCAEVEPRGGDWSGSPERQRLLDAVLAGNDVQIDAAVEALVHRVAPEVAMLRCVAASSRQARRLEVAKRFEEWARQDHAGRTDALRARVRELQCELRTWFSNVSVAMDGNTVTIVAHRRPVARSAPPVRVETGFDRREWVRSSGLARCTHRLYGRWAAAEILGALQAWADANGRSPRPMDWVYASIDHPDSLTVRRHFKTWNRAVRRAGLKPLGPDVHPWSDDEVIGALRRWAAHHGRAPRWEEWMRAGPGRPSKTTVVTHFGGWRAALAVAGLDWRPWSNDALIRSLQRWTEEHGRPPKAHEWDRAGPGRPSRTAVCLRFGSWRAGLAAAGLRDINAPSPRP